MTEGYRGTEEDFAHLRLQGLNFLTRLLSGVATEVDAAELVAWRMQSRAHEQAFRAAVRLRQLVRMTGGMADASTPEQGRAPASNVIPFDGAQRASFARRAAS